jgi:hypothetical protein
MLNIDTVLSKLPDARQTGTNQWMALCRAHDDHSPSLSIWLDQKGKVGINCLAGCKYPDVLKSLGLNSSGKRNNKKPRIYQRLDQIYIWLKKYNGGKLESLHEYKKLSGKHNQFVIRWRKGDGDKIIIPAVQSESGIVLGFPEKRLLYRLPEIVTAEKVIVCEGEKKVDALFQYGFAATCSPGGAKAANYCDWTPLKNKQIIFWPDNDPAGQSYIQSILSILRSFDA